MQAPSPPELLPFAHPADIVRAHQKDEQCRGLLRRHACEAFEELIGPRRAAPWQATVAAVSDAAYSVATAVLSGNSLGEEYAELLAVTSPGLRAPSRTQRVMASLPPALPWDLLRRATTSPAPAGAGRIATVTRVVYRVLVAALAAAPPLLRLHLAAFYVFGAYRHISERCAGVRVLSLSDRPYRQFSYRALGVLLALQVMGELGAGLLKRRRRAAEVIAAGSDVAMASAPRKVDMGRAPLCQVCMCPCEHTTSTTCGHLFCWECIASWCAMKASCPLCRATVLPQQLLPLSHYEVPASAGS